MILGTMLHRSSVLTPFLDGALESMALGNGGCIYMISGCEDVSLDLLLDLILISVLERELSEVSLVLNAGFVKCAFLGLVDQLLADRLKSDLHSLIAVILFGLDLRYYARRPA